MSPHIVEKCEAHTLFHLTVTNDGDFLINMYVDIDLEFIKLMVQRVTPRI